VGAPGSQLWTAWIQQLVRVAGICSHGIVLCVGAWLGVKERFWTFNFNFPTTNGGYRSGRCSERSVPH
jgi:hypothetical protein